MIDWGTEAAEVAAGIEEAAEAMTFTRRLDQGNPFAVRGVVTTPGESDLTAGITTEHQLVKFAPAAFLAASGNKRPYKGDIVTFGGLDYAVDAVTVVRRGGVDLVYNVAVKGG